MKVMITGTYWPLLIITFNYYSKCSYIGVSRVRFIRVSFILVDSRSNQQHVAKSLLDKSSEDASLQKF